MSKTKAELVAENRMLKAGMSKTKEKLIEQNDILDTRLFHHAEFINGLEDELKRNQEWLVRARKDGDRYQKNYDIAHARNLDLAEKYGVLTKENVRLTDLEDRYARTIDSFNRLICDHDSELYT